MNAKLFYQILLLLGCLAAVVGVLEPLLGKMFWLSTQGWWRAAIACWVLLIAVKMVYQSPAK